MGKAIFDGPIARARGRNRSEMTRIATRGACLEPLFTPGGIYFGDYHAMPLDWERISRSVGMMIRGLYWQLRGEPFSQDYRISVVRVDPLEVQTAWTSMSAAHFNGPYCLGDGVFACVMQFVAEDTGMTRWLLRFYQNYVLLVTTKPEAQNPEVAPPW
jgi:hypothetical protein